MGGEALSFLSGPGHWEFSHTPMSAWATKLDLTYFLFFFGGGHRGGRVDLGGMGNVIRCFI